MEDFLPGEKCLCEVLSDVELAWEDGSVRHEKGGSRAPSREPTHVVGHVLRVEDEEDVHVQKIDAENKLCPREGVRLEVGTAGAARFHLRGEDMVPQPVRTVLVLGEAVDHEDAKPKE